MNKYFYAQNSWVDRSIIDDNYKNYFLSRKLYAKDLPIVTVSEANGYVIKGSVQLRSIELQGDEFFVAVGRDFDKDMYHYIFSCFKYDNGELKIKHFLCAAQYVNLYEDTRHGPAQWMDSDRTEQGIQYAYTVPDDLCVYIFSKTPKAVTERFGFQVLKPSGNTSEVVFDSRYKYLDVICESHDARGSNVLDLIGTKKIAVGIAGPVLWAGYNGNIDVNIVASQGLVIFGKGHTAPTGYVTPKQTFGAGSRIFQTWYNPQSMLKYGMGKEKFFYIIDVNGF